jgi:hypothetical protein
MDITKGHDFSDNVIDAARLNKLVVDAVFTNITNPPLLDSHMPYTSGRPAVPADGDFVVKDDGTLEWYDGSAWQTPETLPMTITLTNKAGKTMLAGEVAVVDVDNDFSFEGVGSVSTANAIANVRRRCIGVCAEEIANDAAGQIYVRGTCYAAFKQGTFAAGTWITCINALPSGNDERWTAVNVEGPQNQGVLLESLSGAATTQTGLVLLWR